MKRIGSAAACLTLCLCLLASTCLAAEGETPELPFPDIEAHWARETLLRALDAQLLCGFEDGTLRPDDVITQAQILQILCRALPMEPVSAPKALGLGGGEWYADAALAAYDRGLISGVRSLSDPMRRCDAMLLLCRAFGLADAGVDPAVLEPFAEESAAPEVLSLVAQGIVEGDGDSLELEKLLTRAEFMTMLFRALDVPPRETEETSDAGIAGVSFRVTAKDRLRPNELLRASAVLKAPESALGKTVTARWSLGGVLLEEQTFCLAQDGQKTAFSGAVPVNAALPESASVVLELICWGRNGAQILRGESEPVDLTELSEAARRERVLALVQTGYEGDYTVEWARQHDYSAEDKTLWVNARDYASDTEYLIWVGLKYQRCDIFQGSQGAWRLVRSCIVGTGAQWSETPVGVWKTTYKQELGWTTDTYTVRPVVRFKGGGYAFHSRLYAPNSSILTEPDVGYPMSHGCVRMLDEDIQWVFDNIPENTTVVVF